MSLLFAICHNGDLTARFNPKAYGSVVASILALDQNGERLVPLAEGTCPSSEVRHKLAATSQHETVGAPAVH